MAGRSRFRHGRKRSASGVVSVLKEARTPLERLAGHLESELEKLESSARIKYPQKKKTLGIFEFVTNRTKEVDPEWRGKKKVTTFLRPLGKRNPRVSPHKGHITVSWQGDARYHARAWSNTSVSEDPISYEAKIFFKGTVEAPADWLSVYEDFSSAGSATPQRAWNNISSNSFFIICRNSVRQPANRIVEAPGKIKSHQSDLSASLEDPKQWKWFAFPGVGGGQKLPDVTSALGQMNFMIPGGKAHKAVGRNTRVQNGQSEFIEEHECATAIITKVFPNAGTVEKKDRFGRFLKAIRTLLYFVAGIVIGALLTLFGHWFWEVTEECRDMFFDLLAGEARIESIENIESREREIETRTIENETLNDENELLAAENERLHSVPHGLDKPPCWPDDKSRLKFLLEIYISDAGLEIKDAPGKATWSDRLKREYKALPFNKDIIGRTISAEEFKREFESTFDATRAAECRHFIIIDEGIHTEVNRYKHDRDMIEGYFYIKRRQFGKN